MVSLLGGKYSRKLQVCHVESNIKVEGKITRYACKMKYDIFQS